MKLSVFWEAFAPSGWLLHREQVRYVTSVDSGGHREALLHWAKKTAKSSTAAVRGLHHVVADTREPDERLVAIASHDEEQSRVIFTVMAQIIARHPWLSTRLRVTKNEIVFDELQVDPRTGGQFTKTHRIRALARDTRGLHGEPWSLVIRDEIWAEPDHAMSEALIPSPTRVRPEILYLSYSPLATMRKAGVPLHDLLIRVREKDPTLFYSFIGGQGEDASWHVCPWVGPDWIDQQRRLFAASPSRFRRVVLNEEVLGGDGDTLLTVQEIQAALDQTRTPGSALPGMQYLGGLDLGVSNDHAALVIGHLDGEGKFLVDVCQVWKPQPNQPISFYAIADAIMALALRFPLSRLLVDQWNAKLLVEMLERAHIPARAVTIESTKINAIITVLKAAFSRRAIRIHPSETYLIEQLEALRTLETRSPRRDLLKFAPSGTGPDASQHDDAAIALGLCLSECADKLGQTAMAEMTRCEYEQWNDPVECYLWNGQWTPHGWATQCRQCPGHQSTVAAVEAFAARTGEYVAPREFVRRGLIQPNSYVLNRRFSHWFRNYS